MTNNLTDMIFDDSFYLGRALTHQDRLTINAMLCF